MSKFKKVDREFVLSDSSLNSYSYRLLTSGYLMDEFKKNPIGYYMHGTDEHPREQGVLVKWESLRIEGDVIYGKPCINLTHPRGQRTIDEIESGFLNAASFGNMRVLEISSDPADYLPGQTGLSASKWYNRECSLVDLGGNYNATAPADLYDENDHLINLSDFTTQKFNMNKIILTPAQMAAFPNLKADADQAAFDAAFADLVAKAGKVDALNNELENLKATNLSTANELTALKAESVSKEVENLIDGGIAAKKLTVAGGNALKAQFETNPTGLKSVIDALQPIVGIVANLDPTTKTAADLMAKTYEELDKSGKLQALKDIAPDSYFEKFENKFGKRHQGDTRK